MQVLDLTTLAGTRGLVIEGSNPQAKISLLEHFGKIMPNPLARSEVLGIVMQLTFEVGALEPVGNPQWAITIR